MKAKTLLYAGVVAGPLFIVAVFLEGATRAGYSPLRHPISSLALGEGGWMQTATFLVTGALSLAAAAGLARTLRARAVIVALWGAGMIGAGLFVTDPVNGYPNGTPDVPVGTASGMLHNVFALIGAVALLVGCIMLRTRGGGGWRAYSLLTGAVFLVSFGLSSAGFGQSGLVDIAGLLQRIAVIAAWIWLTALAVRALRQPSQPALR